MLDAGVWVNGDWYARDAARISTSDRGFLLGDGCFETLRYAHGHIEGVKEHLALLRQSAKVLAFTLPVEDIVIEQALTELAQELKRLDVAEAAVRLTLSRGAGGRGADSGDTNPTLVIQASLTPLRAEMAPLSVVTVAIRRNETSPLSRIKSLSYGDNLFARRLAVEQAVDEALMLNTQGRVACLSMANLVVVDAQKKWIKTPSAEEGARPGYMRGRFLKWAKASTWTVEDGQVLAEDLQRPDVSVFALNSLWGLRPIARLDGLDLSRTELSFTEAETDPRPT